MVGTPAFGERPQQKNSQQGTVSVAEDSQNDGKNAGGGVGDHDPGGDGADYHEKPRKSHGGPAGGAEGVGALQPRGEEGFVPVTDPGSSQSVEGGTERAHGGGKDAGNEKPAEPRRELVKNIVGKHVGVAGGEIRVGIVLVVDIKKNADPEEGEHDGDIGQAGTDEGEPAAGGVLGCEHPLDHVLIRSVGGHGDKGGGEESGPDGVITLQDAFQGSGEVSLHDRAKAPEGKVAGLVELCGDGGQPAGNGSQEMPKHKAKSGKHDDRLNHIRPNHGLDAAGNGVDGGEQNEDEKGGKVDAQFRAGRGFGAGEHLPTQHENDGGDVESGTAGQGAGDQEDGAGGLAGLRPKSFFQELVDGDDVVGVVRLDEDPADEDAGEHSANGELGVGEIAQGVALAGGAEEGGGTDFGGKDGGKNGPPGHLPPA